ncbi:MAG TPA: hypothetical protein VF576_06070 [Rubricoccaceae bacterium]|jgi:hypothetical protein
MKPALALVLLVCAQTAAAQAVRLDVQVVQIAGADVYLDRGVGAGLAPGDTAEVERAGVVAGALQITSATATRAVATVVGAPFPLTRGDRLVLLLARAAAPPPPAAEPPTAPGPPARTSILARPADSPIASVPASRMRVTGRVQTGLSGYQSTTTPSDGAAPVGRTDALPFVSLRADVTGLPGGARLRLNGRAARTGAAGVDVSLYEVAVEAGRGAVHVQAGRFASQTERTSGFWDGLDVRVGSERAGAGALGGLQPDRTTGLPGGPLKLAAYAYLRRGPAARRVWASVTGGRVGDAPFAGADVSMSGDLGGMPVGLTADGLVDASGRGPADSTGGAWGLARASVRLTAAPGPARLRLAYRRLRPSALTLANLPVGLVFIPVVAESATVGLSVDVGRGSRRPTVYADAGLYRRGGAMDGRSVGGGLLVSRLPGVPVGLGIDATLFSRDDRQTLSASATLRADVRTASVSLGVRTAQTDALTYTTRLRTVEVGLSLPISRRVGLVAQASTGGGGGLHQSTLYTSLWLRL